MKTSKVLSLVVALSMALTLPFATLAQEDQPTQLGSRWAKGTVTSPDRVNVYAPIGGQLKDFDLAPGDALTQDEGLFDLEPLKVLAPKDGVIRLARAQVGTLCQQTIAQYGALCYLDQPDLHIVNANTRDAHDDPDSRAIVLGETLRVYNGKSYDVIETTGTVIAVDGAIYVVEIPAGVFDLEDSVRLYRGTGKNYDSEDQVGKGKVARPKPLAILGDGMVADARVGEGQEVKRGEALYLLDGANTSYSLPAGTHVVVPQTGIVQSLHVQPGQQVMKDQLLLAIDPQEALELTVDVDELDVTTLREGQLLQVKIDAMGGQPYEAAVKRVNPQGFTVLDTTKYSVTLTLTAQPQGLLPGMHVTAYWN